LLIAFIADKPTSSHCSAEPEANGWIVCATIFHSHFMVWNLTPVSMAWVFGHGSKVGNTLRTALWEKATSKEI